MFENWQKFVSTEKIIVLFLRISLLHEKYPYATLKNLLVSPKDKDTITKKSSVIYWFMCDRIDCADEYIGGSSRTFAERYKEYLKASPILSTSTTLTNQHP